MNYFTKEQLEDITNSILSNPVIETLKELYDKYSDNKEETVEEPVINEGSNEVQDLNQSPEISVSFRGLTRNIRQMS